LCHIFCKISPRLSSIPSSFLRIAKLFQGCRNDKVWNALLAEKFRCPEGSVDMLFEQKPYRGIDGIRNKFLSDSCHDIDEHICRIRVLAGGLSVVRKLFAPCALASPFNVVGKVIWPKFMGELKSVTVIFSHNLLNSLVLQHFSKTLTGQ